jgi:hypothetical protein
MRRKYTVELYNDDEPMLFIEDSGWELKSFNSNHINYIDPWTIFDVASPTQFKYKKDKKAEEAKTLFVLSYYEHGGCVWSLKGEGPQCQWDSTPVAGILRWNEKATILGKTRPSREFAARNWLEYYNCAVNGEVYGFTIYEEGGWVEQCGQYAGNDLEMLTHDIRELTDDGVIVEITGDALWLSEYLKLEVCDGLSASD